MRCLAVSVLLVAGVRSPSAYGLCLVAGHLAALIWPSALRFSRERTTPTSSEPVRLPGRRRARGS